MSYTNASLRPGMTVRLYAAGDLDLARAGWFVDAGGAYVQVGTGDAVYPGILGQEFVLQDIGPGSRLTGYLVGGVSAGTPGLYTLYTSLVAEITEDPYLPGAGSGVLSPQAYLPLRVPRCDCGAAAVGAWHPHMPECVVAGSALQDIRHMVAPPGPVSPLGDEDGDGDI